MNLQDYYTTGDFGSLIGVCGGTIRTWDKSGKLKPAYVTENGFRYYSKEQLVEVLKNRGEDIQGMYDNTPPLYLLSCWGCGIAVPKHFSGPKIRIMCDDCKPEYEKDKEETLKEYIRLKMKVMYERALRILEKSQKVDMHAISEAAKAVEEYSRSHTSAFVSSHEMIAAMVLIHHRIKIKMQYKVNTKRIDIYAPELNCGVEVDGAHHKGRELKDSARDILIRGEMGSAFEIIRIPVNYIEQNPIRITTYIKNAYRLKKELRLQYDGLLPDNYSKREYETYKKCLQKR